MQRPQGPKWINKPQHSGATDELNHREGNNTPTQLSSRTGDAVNATRHCGTQPAAPQPPLSAHECECAAQGTLAAATAHATHGPPIASPLNSRCSLQFAI